MAHPGHEVGVAAEQDVGAAAGHVGGDGHAAAPPALRDDLRLALHILRLCVQQLVGYAWPGQGTPPCVIIILRSGPPPVLAVMINNIASAYSGQQQVHSSLRFGFVKTYLCCPATLLSVKHAGATVAKELVQRTHTFLLEHGREGLGALDAGGAHEHGPPLLVEQLDLRHHRRPLACPGTAQHGVVMV